MEILVIYSDSTSEYSITHCIDNIRGDTMIIGAIILESIKIISDETRVNPSDSLQCRVHQLSSGPPSHPGSTLAIHVILLVILPIYAPLSPLPQIVENECSGHVLDPWRMIGAFPRHSTSPPILQSNLVFPLSGFSYGVMGNSTDSNSNSNSRGQ